MFKLKWQYLLQQFLSGYSLTTKTAEEFVLWEAPSEQQ